MAALQSSPADAQAPLVLIWDLPTRAFHWLLVFSFAAAYVTAEWDRFLDLHAMFGYTVGGLVVFRLLWGVLGTRHARFASFWFRPADVLAYLRSIASLRPRHYTGHNPAGAVAIFALLGLTLAVVASGFTLYWGMAGKWMEDIHEAMANAMLVIVGVHIAGALVSSLLHRENLVRAMVTGRKAVSPEQGIAGTRALLGGLLVVAVLAFWVADRGGWVPHAPVAARGDHARGHDHGRD
ncbi:MAG: cytochrome B [Betaproteobacteria bacterium]|nr:cytochrome B [Betaproteobacteria bacterium]